MKYFLILLVFFSSYIQSNAQQETLRVQDLISSTLMVKEIGGNSYLGIFYKNAPSWHTYWKNPGDAGTPFKHHFSNLEGKEIQLEEMEWPIPKRFDQAEGLQGFGYKDLYGFFYRLKASDLQSLKNGVELKAQFLICAHLCIPGEITTHFQLKGQGNILKQVPSSNETLKITALQFETLLNDLPSSHQGESAQFFATKSGEEKKILLWSKIATKGKKVFLAEESNFLFFFPSQLFSFKHEEKKVLDNSIIARLNIDWDGDYLEIPQSFPSELTPENPLKFKILIYNPDLDRHQVQEVQIKSWASADELTQLEKEFSSGPARSEPTTSPAEEEGGLFFFIVMGILGGLILNLMPCVLPVVSLKLFGLISLKKLNNREIFRHNFYFSLGIYLTLISLSVLVILLQQAGRQVGWGFQLQSPYFVAGMIFLIYTFALNLFGLFEFRTPGGQKISNFDTTQMGPLGEIFNGMITTLLATPCSAPFLGTALTFAFGHGPLAIVGIFSSIAFGLSLPFLLTGIFPQLINFLPRPGAWMEHLKKFLGLGLLLTLVWLLDIYIALVENDSLLVMLCMTCMVFIFFTLYFSHFISKNRVFQIPFYLLTLFSLVFLGIKIGEYSLRGSTHQEKEELVWHPWSEELMRKGQEEKRIQFLDFTAKWCLTCKVNEKLVLQRGEFKALAQKYQLQLLLGDWTKHDEKITTFLHAHQASAVPAYYIVWPNGKIQKLSELLSADEISRALETGP